MARMNHHGFSVQIPFNVRQADMTRTSSSMKFRVILTDKYAVTSWQDAMIFLSQAFDAAAAAPHYSGSQF
jgi:hypothetical protein